MKKRCPACKALLDREKDFGKRIHKGKPYPRSYCKKCDSTRPR